MRDEDGYRLETENEELRAEVKRLRKVGRILAEEIVVLTEELIKLRAKDEGPIDYIIDSHGMTHASFTIVYKPEVQAQ